MDEFIITFGLIDNIKVGYDNCRVQVRNETTEDLETFFLFLFLIDQTFPVPEIYNSTATDTSVASLRVINSMQLSLLRDALANNLRVGIRHRETSNFIERVFVFSSPVKSS